MHLNFVTLFDSNYLNKGIALAESLARVATDYTLYIFAFDDATYDVLKEINIPNVELLKEDDLLDDYLKRVKQGRSRAEYCWTCTSVSISYVMNTLKMDNCTYLDTDMLFWSDPRPLIDELIESGGNVLIVPHFFINGIKTNLIKRLYGNFCVEFNTFIGDKGREVLAWWMQNCLEDCYVNSPRGYYGDQKYLDYFCTNFECVHVLQNRGGGVGPWNIGQYKLVSASGNDITFDFQGHLYKLVFYHYQGMRSINDSYYLGQKIWSKGKEDAKLVEIVYGRYIKELGEIEKKYPKINSLPDKKTVDGSIEQSKKEHVKSVSMKRRIMIRLLSLISLPSYLNYRKKDFYVVREG